MKMEKGKWSEPSEVHSLDFSFKYTAEEGAFHKEIIQFWTLVLFGELPRST